MANTRGRPSKYDPKYCDVAREFMRDGYSFACVYALTCPSTGEIRYIGKTKDIKSRFKSHCNNRRIFKKQTYYGNWIRSLASDPGLIILSKNKDLDAEEIRLIKHYRELGANLVNTANGGQGYPETPIYKIAREMRSRFGLNSKAYLVAKEIMKKSASGTKHERFLLESACAKLVDTMK